jgi:hypothetical protein
MAARIQTTTSLTVAVRPAVKDDLTERVIEFDDALTPISRIVTTHPLSGAGL